MSTTRPAFLAYIFFHRCSVAVAASDGVRHSRRDLNGAAMAILIRDTTVVTVDGDDTIHHNAALAIEGDRIVAVGASDELAVRFAGAESIDGSGKVVMPGFANVHTH